MATSEGSWRLKLIIMLTIMLTLLYSSYGVFGSIEVNEFNTFDANYTVNDSSSVGSGNLSGDYSYDSSSGQSFIDTLTGFGSFLTFGEIDNFFARMVINTFTSICFICIGYLIYTFIRDWVPFVG